MICSAVSAVDESDGSPVDESLLIKFMGMARGDSAEDIIKLVELR